jgi:hypothetical protein
MRCLSVFFVSLLFTCAAVSQISLTKDEQKVGEVYADYVSNQLFVDLCSKFEDSRNYKEAFKHWIDKNQEDIKLGKVILTRHYSSQDIDIVDIFKWKTDAEKRYFEAAVEDEKTEVCKDFHASFSQNEN